jgi:membrane protease YdiL (CAAX protease family)
VTLITKRRIKLEDFIKRGDKSLNKVKSLYSSIFHTIKHLSKRVIQSPLLLSWLIIGTIIDFKIWGNKGLKITIINLILLALYTLIIKIMTDNKVITSEPKLSHPKFEFFTGILFYIFLFAVVAALWGQAKIPFISEGITELTLRIKKLILNGQSLGISTEILKELYYASINIILELVPVIILFLIWGYGLKDMGFVFGNLPLIVVLLLITILIGLPSKFILQQPFHETILLYCIRIFINGLPEELIFRGFLLPRFEAILKNKIKALVIVSLLFNMLHLPSYLAQGVDVYKSLLICFGIFQPTGLIWGYLYLKTRSIVPGAIWHTSFTVLGTIFISTI